MDLFILSPLIIWIFWTNGQLAKRENYSQLESWFLQGLFAYHLCFAFIFHYYIQTHGGDALRYWNLSAEIPIVANGWMDYWGSGTMFIQWINYIPSRVLGLQLISGNILYSCMSFIGIRMLYKLVLRSYPSNLKSSILAGFLLILVFLLPNLHFWTSGVGKETFIFLGWIGLLTAIGLGKKYWIYGILGITVLFMVRPIAGLIGLTIGMVFLFMLHKFNKRVGFAIILLSVVVGAIMLHRIYVISHVEGIGWGELIQFQERQFDFLKGFGANTEVPMGQYSLPYQFWTLYFRPFWTDVNDFWSFLAALENQLSILLLLSGMISVLFFKQIKIPPYLIAGLLIGVMLSIILLFNLNNLGIMVRMKSSFMIFYHLAAVNWLIFNWKYYTCRLKTN